MKVILWAHIAAVFLLGCKADKEKNQAQVPVQTPTVSSSPSAMPPGALDPDGSAASGGSWGSAQNQPPASPTPQPCAGGKASTTCESTGYSGGTPSTATALPTPTATAYPKPQTCRDADCGPRPQLPSYLCSDGKTVSGVGPCQVQDKSVCAWTIVRCPKDPYQNYQSQ